MIELEVSRKLDRFELDVTFQTPAAITAVLGPSGSGKSLTLTAVAGHEPGARHVLIGGRDLAGLPPERRRLGYVAQTDTVFDHMSVEDNVAFSGSREVGRWLEATGLAGLDQARPDTLSGGERRRLVLARALASRPDAILLDEPFSALDAPLRRQMRSLVLELVERAGVPAILVTHDREDVLELAGFVAVLIGGRVVQAGSVDDVFSRPASVEVARLCGFTNLMPVDGGVMAIPDDAISIDMVGANAKVTHLHQDIGGLRVTLRRDATEFRAVVPRAFGAALKFGMTVGLVIDETRSHLIAGS